MTAAVTCTALAGLVALAAYGGVGLLAVAVLVVQGLLLAGVFRHVAAQAGRQGAAAATVVAGSVAVACDVALLVRDEEPLLAPLAGILGLTFLGAVVAQVVRRDGRSGLVASFTATLAAATVVAMAAMLIAAGRPAGGPAVVTSAVVGAAAVVAVATRLRGGSGDGPVRAAAGAGFAISLAGPVAFVTGRLLLG